MNERHPHARPVADDRDPVPFELPTFERAVIGIAIAAGLIELAYQIALAIAVNARLFCP